MWATRHTWDSGVDPTHDDEAVMNGAPSDQNDVGSLAHAVDGWALNQPMISGREGDVIWVTWGSVVDPTHDG
jgi:hypothetical protein